MRNSKSFSITILSLHQNEVANILPAMKRNRIAIIVTALIWAVVILAADISLQGTGYMRRLTPILGGGAAATIILLGGLLRRQ